MQSEGSVGGHCCHGAMNIVLVRCRGDGDKSVSWTRIAPLAHTHMDELVIVSSLSKNDHFL